MGNGGPQARNNRCEEGGGDVMMTGTRTDKWFEIWSSKIDSSASNEFKLAANGTYGYERPQVKLKITSRYSSLLYRLQLLWLAASDGVMLDWRNVLQNWVDWYDIMGLKGEWSESCDELFLNFETLHNLWTGWSNVLQVFCTQWSMPLTRFWIMNLLAKGRGLGHMNLFNFGTLYFWNKKSWSCQNLYTDGLQQVVANGQVFVQIISTR